MNMRDTYMIYTFKKDRIYISKVNGYSDTYSLLNLDNPNGVLTVASSSLDSIINAINSGLFLDYNIPFTKNDNIEGKRGKHLAFWLHVTNRCNLDCTYCYIDKDNSDMHVNTIIMLSNVLKNSNAESVSITFAGGEPTLNLNLMKFATKYFDKYIPEIRKNYSISTNALKLDNNIIDFIISNNIKIYASLDGLNEFNIARKSKNGKYVTNRIINNILKLKEYGVNPMIGIVVSPWNVRGLTKITRFLLSHKLQFKYSFYRPVNYINNIAQLDKFKSILEDEIISCFKCISEYSYFSFNPEIIFDKFSVRSKNIRSCSMGDFYFAISHKGTIHPCHMLQDHGGIKLLPGINIDYYKSNLNNYEPLASKCYDCDIVKICRGGCRLIARGDTPLYCDVYKKIFPHYIELISSLNIKHANNKIYYDL